SGAGQPFASSGFTTYPFVPPHWPVYPSVVGLSFGGSAMVRAWWRWASKQNRMTTRGVSKPGWRLVLEVLEDRTLPSFMTAPTLPTGTSPIGGGTPVAVATGAFNGDGKLDVVTANLGSNSISLLRGNGNGTFHAASSVAVGFAPTALAVADF